MNNTLIMTDAVTAYKTWYLVDIDVRIDLVERALRKSTMCDDPMVLKITRDTKQSIGETLLLPGPTGESNELYTQGRGVVLINDSIDSREQLTALGIHVSVATIAGNSVIIATDDQSLIDKLEIMQSELPHGLLQCISKEDWMSMLEHPIAVVTLLGETHSHPDTLSTLAKSTGALVPVLEDDGTLASPVLNDPKLSYRYITECTRTINVTAVGGNATLLELSS
jgi:delta 1-pyrroline-5-carboxylate dehydrogenase